MNMWIKNKENFKLLTGGYGSGKTEIQAIQLANRISKAIGHIIACGEELNKDQIKYLLKILKGED